MSGHHFFSPLSYSVSVDSSIGQHDYPNVDVYNRNNHAATATTNSGKKYPFPSFPPVVMNPPSPPKMRQSLLKGNREKNDFDGEGNEEYENNENNAHNNHIAANERKRPTDDIPSSSVNKNEFQGIFSFSQDYTPISNRKKSTLQENKSIPSVEDVLNTVTTPHTSRSSAMKRDVQDLLSYIDNLKFTSPWTSRSTSNQHQSTNREVQEEATQRNIGSSKDISKNEQSPWNTSFLATHRRRSDDITPRTATSSKIRNDYSNQEVNHSSFSPRLFRDCSNKQQRKPPYPEMTPFQLKQRILNRQYTSQPKLKQRTLSSRDPPTRSRESNQNENTKDSEIEGNATSNVNVDTSYCSTVMQDEVEATKSSWQRMEHVAWSLRRALEPEALYERRKSIDKSEPGSILFVRADEAVETDLYHDKRKKRQSGDAKREWQSFFSSCSEREPPSLVHGKPSQVLNLDATRNDGDELNSILSNQSRIAIKSPAEARQLLHNAVSALQDARAERESARIWANSVKDSVQKWANEQRQLIESENPQTEIQLDALLAFHQRQVQNQTETIANLEQAVRSLQDELKTANAHRKTTEDRLQQMLLDQQEKMMELGSQLSSMEQIVSEGGLTPRSSFTPTNDAIKTEEKNLMSLREAVKGPDTGDENPNDDTKKSKVVKHKKGSSVSTTSSGRIQRRTENGGFVTVYSNGVRKEVHRDGTTVIRFANGDVETRFPDSGIVAYFHANHNVMQFTKLDGSVIYEYPNRQIELHYPDGRKGILFPDGTKQRLTASGEVEDTWLVRDEEG